MPHPRPLWILLWEFTFHAFGVNLAQGMFMKNFRYGHITKRNLSIPRRRKGRGDEYAMGIQADDQDPKEN